MAITKDQLIRDLAESTDLQRNDVRTLLEQLAEIIADALENDGEISLPGIGKLKAGELAVRKSPVALAMMHAIKQVLDPHGLLNPGKLLAPR